MSKTINVGKIVPRKGIDYFDGIDGTNGKSLEFNWDGTQLGIRQEGQQEYQYQNLKGDTGSAGQNGRDGYVQYTPGNNITIDENNVISANVPQIDLSNYYTKGQINDKVKIYSMILPNSSTSSISNADYGIVGNLVTTAVANGDYALIIAIKFGGYATNTNPFQLYYTNGSLFTSGSGNFTLQRIDYSGTLTPNYLGGRTFFRIQFIGNWNENVFTVTSAYITTKVQNFLSTTNTDSYTPTQNYHPATKKYVDDTVASVGASGPIVKYIDTGLYSSSSTALDMSTLDAGMYILKTMTGVNSNFYMKPRASATARSIENVGASGYFHLLIIPSKLPTTYDNVGRTITAYVYNSMRSGSYIFTDAGTNFNRSTWATLGKESVVLTDEQTLTGKKIFSTLPESSVTPTTNNQLVNKKYVDDAITTAITNTLGGNY